MTLGQTANLNLSNARSQLGLIDNWATNKQLDAVHTPVQAALVAIQPVCNQLVAEGMPDNSPLDPADALTSTAAATQAFGKAVFGLQQASMFVTDNPDYPGAADILDGVLEGFAEINLAGIIASVPEVAQ